MTNFVPGDLVKFKKQLVFTVIGLAPDAMLAEYVVEEVRPTTPASYATADGEIAHTHWIKLVGNRNVFSSGIFEKVVTEETTRAFVLKWDFGTGERFYYGPYANVEAAQEHIRIVEDQTSNVRYTAHPITDLSEGVVLEQNAMTLDPDVPV